MTCTTQKKTEKFYRKKVDINCRVLKKELIFIGLFITNSTENDKRKLIVMKAHSSTKAKIDDSIIYTLQSLRANWKRLSFPENFPNWSIWAADSNWQVSPINVLDILSYCWTSLQKTAKPLKNLWSNSLEEKWLQWVSPNWGHSIHTRPTTIRENNNNRTLFFLIKCDLSPHQNEKKGERLENRKECDCFYQTLIHFTNSVLVYMRAGATMASQNFFFRW